MKQIFEFIMEIELTDKVELPYSLLWVQYAIIMLLYKDLKLAHARNFCDF